LIGIGGNAGGVCAVVDKARGINMPSKPVAAERIGRRRLFFFIGWNPCATAGDDSSAAFRLCTNKAKMNAHLVEKVGFLTPEKRVSQGVRRASP